MQFERLKLKRLNNTRDLGGLPTKDGGEIKRGLLFRSGRLYNLPRSSEESLKDLGIKTIIDLRTDREREEYFCSPIEGIEHIHLPLVCTATAGITHSKSMARTMREESRRIEAEFGTADNYMKRMYEIILFEESSRNRLRNFFDILLNAEGGVLWHCNAGKDRTGLISMLVEGLCGVDEQIIIDDYCASDKFQRKKRMPQKFLLRIFPMPRHFKNILLALIKAKPEYVKGAIDAVKARCGSFENYFKTELSYDESDINAFRKKYVAFKEAPQLPRKEKNICEKSMK
ncbi:MAG: tyrosine-protein phosphatase [Clostridia bacterium]|nr:tyrosine-protein phosphatase [Clostridia bacterium]